MRRVQTMPIRARQQLVTSGHVTRRGQHEVTPMIAAAAANGSSDWHRYRQTDGQTHM